MKKLILQTSAALLSTAFLLPAIASDSNVQGVAGISYGEQAVNSSDSNLDSGIGSIRHEFARIAIPVSDNYAVQLDAEREVYNMSGSDAPQSSSALGVHLSRKIDGVGLVGIFYARGFGDSEEQENSDGWVTGVEGQYYVNDAVTLYSQAGAARIRTDDGEGFLEDGRFVRVAMRYFPADDTMIEIDLAGAYANSYIDGNDDGRFVEMSISAETRLLDSIPLYGTAKLRSSRYNATTENDLAKDTSWMLGVNYRFGSSSLKDNDRNGATLDMPMQPIRAAAFTEALD